MVTTIKTEVYQRGAARFNMCNQFLGYPLNITNEVITQGLAKRLVAWAANTLDDSGFLQAVQGWSVEVYTLDAEDRPADRSYCVRWVNEKGAHIEVVGILTRNGWPSLDHGLEVSRR